MAKSFLCGWILNSFANFVVLLRRRGDDVKFCSFWKERPAWWANPNFMMFYLFYNLPNWIDVGLLMVMCVHVLTLIKVLCMRTTYVREYLVRWILSVLGALFRCFAKYANDAFVEFYVPLGKSSFQLMKTSGDSSPCWYRAHSVPDDALELIRRRRAICKTGP